MPQFDADPDAMSDDPVLDAVKAAYKAKAAEPSPDHLVSLVDQLEAENKRGA